MGADYRSLGPKLFLKPQLENSMSKSPPSPSNRATSRAEKLSLLSAMLGPDAMARVRNAQPGDNSTPAPATVELDAERAAWHRNRLLERLRKQGEVRPAPVSAHSDAEAAAPQRARPAAAETKRLAATGSVSLDARLAKFSDFATLDKEHPAIIARLIKTLPRDERVFALKSLPGPIARSIVRRLR